jgi:hypothetical protein
MVLLLSSGSSALFSGRIHQNGPSVGIMAGSRNAALSRRSLVFPADLIAGVVRLVEPDANIDPGHGGAGESQGVDKPAQRGAPSGLRLRRIVSAIKRDWLAPLVGRETAEC